MLQRIYDRLKVTLWAILVLAQITRMNRAGIFTLSLCKPRYLLPQAAG